MPGHFLSLVVQHAFAYIKHELETGKLRSLQDSLDSPRLEIACYRHGGEASSVAVPLWWLLSEPCTS